VGGGGDWRRQFSLAAASRVWGCRNEGNRLRGDEGVGETG
jgi:hypothetical protein